MNIKKWDHKSAYHLKNHIDPILYQVCDPYEPEKIRCRTCGRRHFPDECTFVTFYGNVCVGLNGGIIGNNFAEDGTLARVSFYCRNERCLKSLFFNDYEDDDEIE